MPKALVEMPHMAIKPPRTEAPLSPEAAAGPVQAKQGKTGSHSATSTMEELPSKLEVANRDSPEPLAQAEDKQRGSPVAEVPPEIPNEANVTWWG